MSKITSLRVQNIRTHHDYFLPLFPGVSLITGRNGSGKTSLVEALYISLRGVSFKGSDNDIIQFNQDWYRIDVEMDDGFKRTITYEPTRAASKKKFIIGGKVHYRLTHNYQLPVVLFEPEDLRLIVGSPARRRLFLDRLISQLDPQYSLATRRYERALRQRNSLLKRHSVRSDELFAWNVTLSDYGAYIIAKRQEFIVRIQRNLSDIYAHIAKTSDTVSVEYSLNHTLSSHKLLHELEERTERDKILGFTSVGPHRHDIIFLFNRQTASSIASRGEIRSFVLALKFIEVTILDEFHDVKPIILLDDVFSELDYYRQNMVIEQFKHHQTIMTSVDGVKNNSHVHETKL